MIKSCPGCRKSYWIKGGTIRIPDETSSQGYYEVDICKRCSQFLEKNDDKLVYDEPQPGSIEE